MKVLLILEFNENCPCRNAGCTNRVRALLSDSKVRGREMLLHLSHSQHCSAFKAELMVDVVLAEAVGRHQMRTGLKSKAAESLAIE